MSSADALNSHSRALQIDGSYRRAKRAPDPPPLPPSFPDFPASIFLIPASLFAGIASACQSLPQLQQTADVHPQNMRGEGCLWEVAFVFSLLVFGPL